MGDNGDPYNSDGTYQSNSDGSYNLPQNGGLFTYNGSIADVWGPGAVTAPLSRDSVEQARMGAGYPDNGKSWDWNAATMGVSRLIDSASRAYAVANGGIAPTYAGQNGLTYQNGRQVRSVSVGSNLLPLLLIGGALLLVAKK